MVELELRVRLNANLGISNAASAYASPMSSRHHSRHAPSLLNLRLVHLPRYTSLRHLSRNSRRRSLQQVPNLGALRLPVSNVVRLELDQRHPWVFGLSVVYTVAEVAEPGRDLLAVDFLDAGVAVVGGGDLAGNGDPVLGG